MYLVRSGAIEGYASMVNRYHQSPTALMAEVGLSPAQLREPDALLSYSSMAELLDLTSLRCGVDSFSLHLAASQTTMIFGELALFTSQQTSVQAVLDACQRYVHLHAMGVNVDVISDSRWTEFTLSFDFTNESQLQQLVQLSAAHAWNMVIAALGGYETGVTMHLRQSGVESELPPAYADKIVFGSHFDGVQFPSAWLTRPCAYHEQALLDYFRQRMQVLENLYPDNLQAQVRSIISDLLASGECTLERVSGTLDMHLRSTAQTG